MYRRVAHVLLSLEDGGRGGKSVGKREGGRQAGTEAQREGGRE